MSLLSRASLKAYEVATRGRDKLFSIAVAGAFESFGSKTVLSLPIRLTGVSRISIGSGVGLGGGCWLQAIAGEDGQRGRIDIADYVVSSGGTVISAASSVVLQRGVLLARGVYIGDHIHAYEDSSRAIQYQGVAKVAPIRVGEGAWLGQNVVVCPGVTIGAGAVIGANSVVIHDVPDYSIAVGAPARVVRVFGPGAAP